MNYNIGWSELQRQKPEQHKALKIIGSLALAGAMSFTLLHQCVDPVVQTATYDIMYNASIEPKQWSELKEHKDFFKSYGSPAPAEMAVAVSQTKRPKLMAAIAVIESHGNPKAVGDSGASVGAFQVQPKHWGKVNISDPVAQALQAEKILEELLVERGRLRQALAAYNGGTRPPAASYRYADKVMRLAGL